MSDDEIVQLRAKRNLSRETTRDHLEDVLALADEALARGAEIARLKEGVDDFTADTKELRAGLARVNAGLRKRVVQLETALRGLQAALTYPQGSDLNGWVQQCMECHQPAPEHEDDCDMGKATALANAALAAGKP